jgi:HPr kinase/phosphorylase
MPKAFTVLDLLDLDLKDHNALNLVCKAGRKGLSKVITQPDINRPGLALSGFFDDFNPKRPQLFGNGETAYLRKLSTQSSWESVEEIFHRGIPCCIFTNSYLPEERFLHLAESHQVPVLLSDLNSSDFTVRIIRTFPHHPHLGRRLCPPENHPRGFCRSIRCRRLAVGR